MLFMNTAGGEDKLESELIRFRWGCSIWLPHNKLMAKTLISGCNVGPYAIAFCKLMQILCSLMQGFPSKNCFPSVLCMVTKTRKKIVQIIRASIRTDEYRKKISESMFVLTARKDNIQFCFAYVCKHFTKQIYLRS